MATIKYSYIKIELTIQELSCQAEKHYRQKKKFELMLMRRAKAYSSSKIVKKSIKPPI